MHSNTRSTMYDRIRYEQASCKEALLAETRSLSSDLSGVDLEISTALKWTERNIRKVSHRLG
jgi:hypothetical protein